MKSFISIITTNIKRNKNTVVFSFAVLILGLILGAALRVGDSLECLYNDYLSNYLTLVFSKEYSPLKLLFERMFNSCLILFLVALCSLNKFSFFLNYFILFYRAFMLGLAGKLFITGAFISGFFTFTFLILVKKLIDCSRSLILFKMVASSDNNCGVGSLTFTISAK